jgi:hypothetical protein
MTHLKELQEIADKYSQHSRAVQYGYNESAGKSSICEFLWVQSAQ